MRILFNSNAPWTGTGYGLQTNLIIHTLRELGHEVAVSAYWGLHGGKIEWDGFTIYPAGLTEYGVDIIDQHAKHWHADVVFTLQDVWVLPGNLGSRGFPWVAMTPIDHVPVPQRVLGPLSQSAHAVVAYSQFGLQELKKAGVDAAYVPHGVDAAAMRPMLEPDRNKAKQWLGDYGSETFLVGMVAANKGYPSRKGFEEAMEAFSRFVEDVPNARLYLHTVSGSQMQGPNLQDMAVGYGIAGKVRFTDMYWMMSAFDSGDMTKLYNAFDVLLSPSYAEGFGVPVVEAQACGTPVIVNGFSAQPELCGAGWVVRPAEKRWTPLGAYQMSPSVPGIVEALHQAHKHRSDQRLRDKAVAFAAGYDQPKIKEKYWRPFMAELEKNIMGKVTDIKVARKGKAAPAGVA